MGLGAVSADDPVTQEIHVRAIVEPHEFAGALVDLGVGHHVASKSPQEVLRTKSLQRQRIDPVRLAAQIPRRQHLTPVIDHVGVGGVLDPQPVTIAPRIVLGVLHETCPQRPTRCGLLTEGPRAHIPVLVAHLSVLEVGGMDHAVPIEHVIPPGRGELTVRAVA